MADSHAKNHDYHLVNASIWPLIGATSALMMAIGAVMWMKGLAPIGGLKLGPFVFGAGLLGVLYTMASWWTDVVKEAHGGDHTRVVQLHHRYGMIMFIASEVMFFVAWFWAYFDASLFAGEEIQQARTLATGGHWPPKGVQTFNPWDLPFVNTVILLLSGTTVTWAHHALLNNDRKHLIMGLWLTVILGVLFTMCQAYEYGHAAFKFGHANDISLTEPKPYIYGATFFMATGFHGAHVIIGTIFLAVCLYRAYLGHFTPKQHLGFEFAAWYWHFVDVVWLFLFAAIYVWGAGTPGAH